MSAYNGPTDYPQRVDGYSPSSMSPKRANTPPKADVSFQSTHTQSSPRSVSFGKADKREEERDKRKKYLTARYGHHQMMLIRKRLAVEDWLYEQLRDLYSCENDGDDHECTLDLEDILNLESDAERRALVYKTLTNVKNPPDIVDGFVRELIQKARML